MKSAGEAFAEEASEPPTHSNDVRLEEPVLDAPAGSAEASSDASVEPPAESPHEEESSSPAVPTSAESPVEEEAVSEESEPQDSLKPVAADAEAQDIEPVSDAVESTEAENQTSGESIETVDVSAEQAAAPEESVAEKPMEAANQGNENDDSAPGTQEEPVESPQQLDHDAANIASDDIEVVETSEQPSDNPSSTEPAPENIPEEDQSSEVIPEGPSSTSEAEPDTLAVPPESEGIGTVEVPTESENTPDSAPVEPSQDPDEIVQIIDVGDDGSTDDTAAIVVPPPPPPPLGQHVTIAEPIKPPKSSKKKSSSSKSRSVAKSAEKPVEVIQLKEGKSKTVSKGKGKKKNKSRKGGEVENEELMPPPPPMIVDVPPRAPSPPPSGLIIDVIGDEEVHIVECPEENDHPVDVGAVAALEAESDVIEVAEAEGVSIIVVLGQETESAETKDLEEGQSSPGIPSPPEVDVTASSPEDGHEGESTESGTGVDEKPELAHEETTSQPDPNLASAEDSAVDSPSNDTPPPESPLPEKSDLAESTTPEPDIHDEVTAEEQTEDTVTAETAESPVKGNGEAESTPALVSESSADEEPGIVQIPSAAAPEEDAVSDIVDKGVDEEKSPESSIEQASSDDSSSDTVESPPGAPIPPESAAPDANFHSSEGEDSQHQTSAEAANEVVDEDVEPDKSLASMASEPERASADEDSEPKPDDHSVTPEHAEEAEAPDTVVVNELADSLDSDASPVQTETTPSADLSILPDDADIDKEVDEHIMDVVDVVEGATEPLEIVTAALDEQTTSTLDAPETSEDPTTDSSSPVVEKSDAVDTAEVQQVAPDQEDISQDEAKKVDISTSEAEARAELVDDVAVQDPQTPVTKQDGEEVAGVVPDPDSFPGSETKAVESAEVLEEAVSAEACAEAEEVLIQHVIDEVEKPAAGGIDDQEPAADGVECVTVSEPASEEVDKASEPLVVESADSEAREEPEERDSTNSTESPDTEDLSAQPVEPTPESPPEQAEETIADPINIPEDATPSTAGDGAQTEDQDSPDLSVRVLAEEAQVVQEVEGPEATAEDLPKSGVGETTEVTEPVDTAPLLEEPPESDEISSPRQQPILSAEEEPVSPAEEQPISPGGEDAIELHQLAEAKPVEPDKAVESEPPGQEPVTEADVLPEDSTSQQSRCETLLDSEPGRGSPLVEKPTVVQPAPVEAADRPPSKHSSKVSFDEPPISSKVEEPPSPPKERRKSSKSSSHRHSSSRHKVKDVSSPPPDQRSAPLPPQPRRRSSTAKAPPPGLFRTPSTTKPRSSRAEAAEQAEIRRRAAELAAREQEVQRQLERARRRAALEEKERQLREQEEELARLKAIEKEQKRARRDEQKRRAQEALEQERIARERAEEEARQKEFERAERRKRRKEAEPSGSRRHRDERPRVRRHSTSHRQPEIRDPSPTPEPKVNRHRTEDVGGERQRSRDEYYIREVPASSKNLEERRHRRSSRRDSERDEKPKKGFWKSILGKI
jgi:hypothetical protein